MKIAVNKWAATIEPFLLAVVFVLLAIKAARNGDLFDGLFNAAVATGWFFIFLGRMSAPPLQEK